MKIIETQGYFLVVCHLTAFFFVCVAITVFNVTQIYIETHYLLFFFAIFIS
jgi:hypothetical protein